MTTTNNNNNNNTNNNNDNNNNQILKINDTKLTMNITIFKYDDEN